MASRSRLSGSCTENIVISRSYGPPWARKRASDSLRCQLPKMVSQRWQPLET